MVLTTFNPDTRIGRIVLRPNRSSSWHSNRTFIATLTLLALLIGLVFLTQGMWLMLPFSLLGAAAVAAALYRCARNCYRQEVLTFSDDQLLIERGSRKPESSDAFHRVFAKVCVHRPRHPWYPITIAIRSHGREVEIGRFLTPDEKQQLVATLRDMIQYLQQPLPTHA